VIFSQFLFGNAVLLYKDIGSDSLIDYYPDFVHLSDYLRTEGFPSWSFYVGMGQDLAYATGYLIWEPVSWLPKAWIAYALVYQHLAKVLFGGLFFFRFLQLQRLASPAPLLGALLLSFSAYMCMGSCWYPLADEVVCFAAILLGTEEAAKRDRWLIFALAIALVGMITPFHLYLCALFLLLYLPARLLAQYGWQPKLILRFCLFLAVIALLGVGLGAVVTLPYLDAILNSPRVSGTTSAVTALSSFPIFGLESARHYVTAIVRSFGNDLLGAGDNYRGWQNYLEAPLTYCGLICLVLFPQGLVLGTRRQRLISIFFFVAMLVPIVFPWFRYLFWAFQGNYYRAYSLFCILGIITLSMMALARYLRDRSLSYPVLGATILVLAAILYLPFEQWQTNLVPGLRQISTFALFLYGTVLVAGQLLKKQWLATWFILGVTAVELIYFDRITVSDRKTVTRQELHERVGYNDETVDAVRDIKAAGESFFRVTKPRPSAPTPMTSLNDAMIFGYYGTSSYCSFNNVNYINFLTAVGAVPPNSELRTRWAFGTLDFPLLSTFAAEKYALVDDPVLYQTILQYEGIKRYGKDYLFLNQLFLPLGLTFSESITEDAFRQLPTESKPEALLRAVVLSGREAEQHGLSQLSPSEVPEEIKATSLADAVSLRRKTALSLTSFRQTRITGTVHLDKKSILVLQTPFDRGWRALQDGQPAPSLKVDVGLLGVVLDAGEHKVELSYRNPYRTAGLAITVASFAILVVGLWRWPRLRLQG